MTLSQIPLSRTMYNMTLCKYVMVMTICYGKFCEYYNIQQNDTQPNDIKQNKI
jgi:hypothetical protein